MTYILIAKDVNGCGGRIWLPFMFPNMGKTMSLAVTITYGK